MYTLPRKKCNFPEVAFLGDECRSVNFRPNVISTILLVTIFACYSEEHFTWWTWHRVMRKNLEIKIVFLFGKSVFPKNHHFVCSCRSWLTWEHYLLAPWSYCCKMTITLCVSGITSRDKFHTSRHPNFEIQTNEILYVPSFAQILGRNRDLQNISWSMEFFIVPSLLLLWMNNTATTGSSWSRIP